MERHFDHLHDIESEALRDRLLPPKSALKPLAPSNTFGEFPYHEGTFDDQPLAVRLQIANSIVRQAIKTNYFPTPESEMVLSGDCTTAAKTLIAYAQQLGISGEFQLASIKKRPHDGDWKQSSRHIVVLHRDENGKYRTIDPTSMVGYGYGTVSEPGVFSNGKLKPIDKPLVYEDVVPLQADEVLIIGDINTVRDLFYHGLPIDTNRLKELKDKAEQVGKGSHMSSWIAELLYIDAMVSYNAGDIEAYKATIRTVAERDPSKSKLLSNPDLPSDVRDVVERHAQLFRNQTQQQVKQWLDEANAAFTLKDDKEYQEGIRLLQYVQSELYHAGLLKNGVPELEIGGESTPLWNINPRLLNEHGVCTAWIKPCSYRLGVENAALESIRAAGNIIWRYQMNPTASMDGMGGYIPMLASHPYAKSKDNFDTYNGPMDILLVKGDITKVNNAKKGFRSTWGRLLKVKPDTQLSWFDGQKIKWSEHLTNYIHSTDSAAETNLHLLLAYPHLSLVNRWDYPHPNL